MVANQRTGSTSNYRDFRFWFGWLAISVTVLDQLPCFGDIGSGLKEREIME